MIFNENCLEGMSRLADESVNLIYTDLPYGKTQNRYDEIIPFDKLWAQYLRVLKPDGAIVLHGDGGIFSAKLLMSNEKMYKYSWCWDKKRGVGHLNAKRMPLKRHEDILVFGKGVINYYPQMEKRGKPRKKGGYAGGNKGNYGFNIEPESFNNTYYPTTIIEFHNCDQGGKVHPNQKPLALAKYIISTYSVANDTVLDSCAGSGTAIRAALDLNRKAVGFEWSPFEPHDEWFKIIPEDLKYRKVE